MPISKKDAIGKIKQNALKEQLSALDLYFSDAEVLDVLPSSNYYRTKENKKGDYWYIEVPRLNMPLQTGGYSRYWAISKKTGEISSVEVVGE